MVRISWGWVKYFGSIIGGSYGSVDRNLINPLLLGLKSTGFIEKVSLNT